MSSTTPSPLIKQRRYDLSIPCKHCHSRFIEWSHNLKTFVDSDTLQRHVCPSINHRRGHYDNTYRDFKFTDDQINARHLLTNTL